MKTTWSMRCYIKFDNASNYLIYNIVDHLVIMLKGYQLLSLQVVYDIVDFINI